tara:strand:+ start:1669 stop:1890 length:222 start_codon:yes stop_codon:yes gene_type:complete
MDFVDDKHFEEWASLSMRIISDKKLLEMMTNTRVLPDPVPEPVVRDHGPVVAITERGEARLQRWANHRLNRWR